MLDISQKNIENQINLCQTMTLGANPLHISLIIVKKSSIQQRIRFNQNGRPEASETAIVQVLLFPSQTREELFFRSSALQDLQG